MPRLGSENLQKQNAGHFGFSHTKIDDLAANGASGYTLVTIVADHSGSTLGFQLPMEAALKEVIGACQKSQRADNLLVRLVTFNSTVTEVHGFRLLSSIILNDYDGVLPPNGLTALYDASTNAIEASNNYGKQLLEQDYDVNGIVVVITDGDNTCGALGVNQVKEALVQSVSGENLESMVSILIGVNLQSHDIQQKLDAFYKDAGFTQFVPLADASRNTLAKLAQFISKSISSQSQHLNSGGPSASINF